MNQQDLRVIKTKKNIEESFLRLLEKKSFSEITVQNILDEALINRSTFYTIRTNTIWPDCCRTGCFGSFRICWKIVFWHRRTGKYMRISM